MLLVHKEIKLLEELLKKEQQRFFISQKSVKALQAIKKKLGKQSLNHGEMLILQKLVNRHKRSLLLAKDKKKLLTGIVEKVEQSLRNYSTNELKENTSL